MTTATLRPNGTHPVGSAGTSVPSGTSHGSLSDNSDTTYVSFDLNNSYVGVEMGTTTLAAGAVTKSLTLRFRGWSDAAVTIRYEVLVARPTGYVKVADQSAVVNYTAALEYTVATVPVTLSQADVDSLGIVLHAVSTSGATFMRIYEAYLDVTSAAQPTVAVSAPTGVQATSRPTVAWTFTPGSDGGPQTHYQVKVFTSAQYGAGGFDPASSTPTYTSGIVAGGAATHTLAESLANAGTFRAYVSAAQTINGVQQWSPWAYSGFTTSFVAALVSSVTATPSNADGYVSVSVARSTSGANTAWEAVTVQRSRDAGVSWETLRGGDAFSAANDFVTSWAANTAVIRDYEPANGESVLYRASAYRDVTGAEVWGPWVQSSSTSWSSSDYWLKNPHDPSVNTKLVQVRDIAGMRRTRAKGTFDIEGRATPIVVSSPVLKSVAGMITFQTLTEAASDAFETLLESASTVLLQMPDGDRWGSRYIGGLDSVEVRLIANTHGRFERWWEVSFVEVDAPEDETE